MTWVRPDGRKMCHSCKKGFKRTFKKQNGRKFNRAREGYWPEWTFHTGPHKLCPKHHASKLAIGAQRRAKKLQAMPKWADTKAIRQIYAECQRITRETGIKHEVDHIVPLNGVKVKGLHVAENLRVIPAKLNRKKSNHFDEALLEAPA